MGVDQAAPDVLGGLEPHERSQVLAGLLALHPELRPEAEELARVALDAVDEDAVADQVVTTYRGMELRRIGERMGPRRGRGYVDENEAAWELLEEALEPFLAQISRRATLGFTDAARRYATAVLAGLDELSERTDPVIVFAWGPPEQAADSLGWSVRHTAAQAGVTLPDTR
jgi:hypothetical protein